MKTLKIIAAAIVLASLAVAQPNSKKDDLLSTVAGHKSLNILTSALSIGGFGQMLGGSGPFTLIAPADQAFVSLPKDDMQKLMSNPAAMHLLLAHYLVRANVAASDAAGFSAARTVMGTKLHTDTNEGQVRIYGARLTEGNIRCSNGMIHVIDTVDLGLVREALSVATPARH